MAINPKLLEGLEASRIDKNNPPKAYCRGLLYGDFGLGKSTWAAKSGLKTLFVDTSAGWVVLMDYEGVDVVKFEGLSQIAAIAQAITEGVPGWDYDLVVIDEISSIYQMDLETVTGARAATSNIRDEVIPEQRDYLASQNRLMKNLRPLLNAPCHVIFLCHERRTKDEARGVLVTESDLAPRLSKEINRGLHFIGRLYIGRSGNRELIMNPERNVQAKNRLGLENNVTLQNVLEKF